MKTNSLRVLQVALGLGWATDVLFYGKSLGISALLFVLLLLGALFYLGRQEGIKSEPRNLWLIAPLIFFASMVFVRANATLTTINVVMVLSILCLLLFFYSSGRIEHLNLLGYVLVLFTSTIATFTQQIPAVSMLVRVASSQRARYRRLGPFVRGLLLAIPVLIVFTILLSSADTIFADLVGNLLEFNFLVDAPELLWRTILVLVGAWLVAGALFFAVGRTAAQSPAHADPSSKPPSGISIGFIEGATVLGLVNVLFSIFAWIQFTFLFSGEALRTMDYEAYREYVRRGFGELLAAAVLTMLLILGLRAIAWKETQREVRIFNLLSSLMVLLAMVLLLSAFMRMVFWENIEFYISTELRIYVRWFIVWLGVLFAWMLLTLWRVRDRFAIGAFAAAIAFFATINVVNPDADVAAHNLKRNDELSTRYLWLLSDDAVPALVQGLDSTSGYVHEELVNHLNQRLSLLEQDPNRREWPAFHISHWEAYRELAALKSTGRLGTQATLRSP